jgi:hypothetical protein
MFPRNEANSPARTLIQDINEANCQQTPMQGESGVETNDEFWMFSPTSRVHHFLAFEKCVYQNRRQRRSKHEDLTALLNRQAQPKFQENNTDVN